MRDLTLKVLKRAKAVGPGSALTPKAFRDLGNRDAVDQALSRLTKAGKIRRISRGVYDVPKNHPSLGPLSPAPGEAGARYDLARPGSLRVCPPDSHVAQIRSDYRDMREMFFGETPPFDQVIADL